MEDKISVIIPVYNVEKYLRKCINSVLNQTYTNLEIILVNDGSSDNCPQICDEYSLKDNRIKVVHKINGGLSDARNAGIEVATGNFLSFIDSDDYIDRYFYEALINAVDNQKIDIVQCEFMKVYEDVLEYSFESNKLKDIKVNRLNNYQSLENLYNANYVNTVIICNKLFRKELFTNIRFPVGKLHEDEFTTYKLLHKAREIVIVEAALYYYLQRSNSITTSKYSRNRLHILEAYSNQIEYFKEFNLVDLEEKSIIKFESKIRKNISRVLISDISKKEKSEFIEVLRKEYKKNYHLFFGALKTNKKKQIIVFLFRFAPNFLLKLIIKIGKQKM